MPFKSGLVLKHHAPSGGWRLKRPLHYITQAGEQIIVPVGFCTDLASVPRIAWRIVPRDHDQARRPSVVHDWIYVCGTDRFTKKQADRIFYEALQEEGMAKPLAWLMYCAVRIGGRGNWKP